MTNPKILHIRENSVKPYAAVISRTIHLKIHIGFMVGENVKIYKENEKNTLIIFIIASLNRLGFQENTLKPKDYTKLAIDTYSKAKWECYGFKGGSKNPTRTIDNYLHIGWGILFQRKLSDSEVQLLKLWIRRRKKAEEYRANDKDTISHRIRAQSEYIDSDGYISMRKIIPTPPNHHPKETKRIQDLLDELKIIKEMWK